VAERPENTILTPVSAGELVDKISILEIKAERIDAAQRRANVLKELAALLPLLAPLRARTPALDALHLKLREVNTRMWDVQDGLRAHEARGEFGAQFIALARAVYRTNAERVALKAEINQLLGSALIEEKQYLTDGN